jgi:apolipoprotein N-acyltransferase
MAAVLPRMGNFARALDGWRAGLFAFVLGAASALGFAPFEIFPLLLLGFAGLVLLIDGAATRPRPVRNAAWLGWAFGFGQFAVGLHWIVYAFLVDPSAHEWQIPFVAVLFPGGLALFIAGACALAAQFWRDGISRIFLFSACYAAAEWLRGHVLTGFPWNIAGYGWGASLAVMQSSALFGVYALTLLTILLGASLAEFVFNRRSLWLPVAMILLFMAIFVGGALRLASTPVTYVPGVRLRIVQPNIPQAEKYRRDYVERNWNRLIALSVSGDGAAPTHIIWPEAAPPFALTRSAEALDEIAVLTGRDKVLMTGAVRVQTLEDHFDVYNSFYIFGPGGKLLATYDKFHLVPFGEYMPLGAVMQKLGITKLVGIPGSFATGDGPHTYDVPGAPPAGPLICYEILFPGAVTGVERPGWIVNATDDSWFGPWAGPRQHLLVARMRAIEQGIPVIRAANSGISAVIDPLGRIDAELGLNRMGVLDSSLPAAIEETPFARFGDIVFWLLWLGCALYPWIAVRNSSRTIAGAN